MRTRTLAAASLVLIIGLVGASPALGHVMPQDGEQMVWGSRYVVVATVIGETTVRRGAAGLIVTQYRLAVEQGLRGKPPAELTVEVVGGTMDGETHTSCLTVHLAVGARYALFVNDPAHPGFSTFTGAQQGVVRDPGSSLGQAIPIESLSGGMAEIAGNKPVSFDVLVERLRAFITRTEALPEPPQPDPVVHAVPLPAKQFTRKAVDAGFDGTPMVPVDVPQSRGPEVPARPDVIPLDASYSEAFQRSIDPSTNYVSGNPALRYVVWNQLPPWFAPWSPRDQSMMARWNTYGDIYRVSASPTGTWDFGNGIFDMTGFPPDADMMAAFGRAWRPGELGVCFSRAVGTGPIIESDISVNPAAAWTTSTEVGTRPEPAAWGFDHVVLHELGHGWGLTHPWESQNVWWDAVMNYAPKQDQVAKLCADDTTAIRNAYPGISIHDGLVSFYHTQDDPNSLNAAYVDVWPNAHGYTQGDTFSLSGAFNVENVGTNSIVNPQVEVYLTHDRMSWSASEYLSTMSYALTIPTFTTAQLTTPAIPISYYTPPGDYWLALWLNDPSDAATYNNGAWYRSDFDRIHISSFLWPINMYTYWQYQQVRTGPNGQYDFDFYADAGDRVDISTCDADGGFANFDTILELKYPFGTVAYSDDYCLLQSRISYYVQWSGDHHLMLRGYAGAFGTSRMQYRARSYGTTSLFLAASAQRAAGTVRLTWSGDSGPYDVERSTTPWFSSPTLVSTDGFGTTLDDPVLTNGVTYYYRAR